MCKVQGLLCWFGYFDGSMLDHDPNLESFFDQTCRNINLVMLMKSFSIDGAAGFCVKDKSNSTV